MPRTVLAWVGTGFRHILPTITITNLKSKQLPTPSGKAWDLRSMDRGLTPTGTKLRNNLGQVVHTFSSKQYNLVLVEGRWRFWLARWPQAWREVTVCSLHRDQLQAQRSVTSMGEFTVYLSVSNPWPWPTAKFAALALKPLSCLYIAWRWPWLCRKVLGLVNFTITDVRLMQ